LIADGLINLLSSLSCKKSSNDHDSSKRFITCANSSINHEGEHFNVRGPLTTPSSPQGKPIAMQAGASDPGIALATKYADAV
jgi:alkanesulfonate monooxygenase SsuD/methylene tetrahydromethanopterin reductase-like flavin-dependent oxidoreductase (luciferase family)